MNRSWFSVRGGVGLNVIQCSTGFLAYPIIAVDLFDTKLALARRLGATHLINSRHTDAKAAIQKIVGTGGVDVAVDNTGQPAVIELAYELTRNQGRTVLVGVPKRGNNISIFSLPLHLAIRN